MSGDSSRDLIDRLAADLRPVRRLPPLVALLALSVAGAVLVGMGVLLVYDPRPGLGSTLARDPVYGCVLCGLVLAGLGASLATLASVVPGRESVQRAAALAAGVGLVIAAAATAVSAVGPEVGRGVGLRDGMCIVRGTLFAAVPAAVLLVVAMRGWSGRPLQTAALALLAAGAVGALLVHLTCPAVDPLHVLCTHAATPWLVAVVFTAAVAPLVRRFAR